MRLARTLRFDESDERIFETPAEPGEWAISGSFEFSNWSEEDLTGKGRQAFANGWLALGSFGRATFVAVAEITEAEFAAATEQLARHFVERYGAPDIGTALPTAAEEMRFMQEMCDDHLPNTLLCVERTLVQAGVSESFRAIKTRDADLVQVAVHGTPD
ncbi:MAG: DUF6505 family protein [Pseudomonadota bacterium]